MEYFPTTSVSRVEDQAIEKVLVNLRGCLGRAMSREQHGQASKNSQRQNDPKAEEHVKMIFSWIQEQNRAFE